MMLGTRHSMLGLLAALCVAAATARAQDVEMASRASGRALPAGY